MFLISSSTKMDWQSSLVCWVGLLFQPKPSCSSWFSIRPRPSHFRRCLSDFLFRFDADPSITAVFIYAKTNQTKGAIVPDSETSPKRHHLWNRKTMKVNYIWQLFTNQQNKTNISKCSRHSWQNGGKQLGLEYSAVPRKQKRWCRNIRFDLWTNGMSDTWMISLWSLITLRNSHQAHKFDHIRWALWTCVDRWIKA